MRADQIEYHDREWGVPSVDDQHLLEHLILSSAQCGLSWSTILAKRTAYRRCFHDFDVAAVAGMGDEDVERAMAEGSGIARNRGKVVAAIANAKLVQALQLEHGSFAAYMWSYVPDGRPIVNAWRSTKEAPVKDALSERLSSDLRRRGFKYVGPTMMYAMMEAVGMINDHAVHCFRHREVQELARRVAWPVVLKRHVSPGAASDCAAPEGGPAAAAWPSQGMGGMSDGKLPHSDAAASGTKRRKLVRVKVRAVQRSICGDAPVIGMTVQQDEKAAALVAVKRATPRALRASARALSSGA